MRLTEAIDAYLASRATQGFATSTLRNNQKHLARFVAAVGDLNVSSIEPRHVDKAVTMMARTCGPSSINIAVSDWGKFFAWCRAHRHMRPDMNPLAERRPLKVIDRPRMRVPLADFPHLLDSAPNPRDRALVATGLYLFLRQGEAAALRVRDLHLDQDEIDVWITKSNKHDTMPLSSELRAEYVRWWKVYEAACGPLQDDWYLLPAYERGYILRNADGTYGHTEQWLHPTRRMSQPHSHVNRALNLAGYATRTETGTPTREGMHTLRRSGARALFDELRGQGYDGALRRVQAWLHHAHSTTTEHYLGLDLEVTQRNEQTKGQPLYPSLADQNVVLLSAHG